MLNKVEICGVNTSKLPLLTSEEMRQLFEAMQRGEPEA
ncbi:MAG: RNA polymerase sigma-G factor, partial [Moorella sp. (in: Bacteria)]|nr:RNA polymerase sigma-G factor [Moorella sp. (in: firmicutes)]